MSWIAEERVVFVHPNGMRREGRIAVGMPTVVVDDVESRCAVALDGLEVVESAIAGGTPLQALLLAIRFLGTLLHAFIARGGRVLDASGEEDVALDAYFGALLRGP